MVVTIITDGTGLSGDKSKYVNHVKDGDPDNWNDRTAQNRILGNFAQINMKADSQADMKFCFVRNKDSREVELDAFSLTFWDFGVRFTRPLLPPQPPLTCPCPGSSCPGSNLPSPPPLPLRMETNTPPAHVRADQGKDDRERLIAAGMESWQTSSTSSSGIDVNNPFPTELVVNPDCSVGDVISASDDNLVCFTSREKGTGKDNPTDPASVNDQHRARSLTLNNMDKVPALAVPQLAPCAPSGCA